MLNLFFSSEFQWIAYGEIGAAGKSVRIATARSPGYG